MAHNQHWQDTHELLQKLVFDLMQSQPAEQITIRHICRLANINRTTFYRHFEDLPLLIKEAQTNKRRELMQTFYAQAEREQLHFLDHHSLVLFLSFIKSNGWFYQSILKNRQDFPIQEGFDQLFERLTEMIQRRQPNVTENELMYDFVAFQSSFTAILKRWAQTNYADSPDWLATVILANLPVVMANALADAPCD
ncbi:TetR family transcriptional regulator [Lactiplantibacillus fabifermentans T30PCM01]|uniref:TetR family transcriptional regulator n=1 Tax=Lactiplantibacillus fabifermentans T30PCM01 TaxID=1400520 RepID=W6T447_9LACO|nr:TetR/AcrR family transcriptional regulator [Lactiplantibacillus fabifermentans]ETY72589.1 TetR family transcriptional regulator [Lactiplantibacillus fabifermentans T30PCM01]